MALLALMASGNATAVAAQPRAGSCYETKVMERVYEPLPADLKPRAGQVDWEPDRLVVLTLANGERVEGVASGGNTTFYGNFASSHRVSLCRIAGQPPRLSVTDLVTGASLIARPRPRGGPAGRPATTTTSPAPTPPTPRPASNG